MPGADNVSKLSIIIPTLNEGRHVGDLLSDVASQTRMPDEVIVVDAGSVDDTAAVVRRFPLVRLLEGESPVACGRNLGGRSASGDVLIFLDADTRLPARFLESFLTEFERRRLDIACPLYVPYRSTLTIKGFHALFNLLTRAFQRTLPSGAGHCVAVRRDVFRESRGFDPGLKFDDIELIRRLSKGRRFGIVEERVFVSDRRYRDQGTPRMILRYALMALIFAFGKFAWANCIEYEFGDHGHGRRRDDSQAAGGAGRRADGDLERHRSRERPAGRQPGSESRGFCPEQGRARFPRGGDPDPERRGDGGSRGRDRL
jgi:glycosyltransferase involved in cell wall biosynthesis